jgi:hypothetical protein
MLREEDLHAGSMRHVAVHEDEVTKMRRNLPG